VESRFGVRERRELAVTGGSIDAISLPSKGKSTVAAALGAQTERQGLSRPVKGLLGGKTSPSVGIPSVSVPLHHQTR
jgi:hypothetical protein